jgi:hypothetical protein
MIFWIACIITVCVITGFIYSRVYPREGFQQAPSSTTTLPQGTTSDPSNKMLCELLTTTRAKVQSALALHTEADNTGNMEAIKASLNDFNSRLISNGCVV